MTRSWEKRGPKNYTSSLAIKTTCTTLKWVSKYDFIFANEYTFIKKNQLHSGLTRKNPKPIWIWSKWAKECLNVTSAREPTYIYQMGIQKLFCIFKPIIPLLPNSLHSRLVKNLRLEWPEVAKKGGPRAASLRSQSRPRVQLANGYSKMISYLIMKKFSLK